MSGDSERAPHQVAARFQAVADRLGRTNDVAAALREAVALARQTVPGCDRAGITQVAARRQLRTLAASDPIVREVDELQYRFRQGPCVTATAEDGIFLADDLTNDTTWPQFSAATVARTPVRSVLSFTVSRSAPRAALNMYGDRSAAFTPGGMRTAAMFAAHAQVLLAYVHAVDRAANLNRALATSRLIGAAIGILMVAQRISADDAFDRLRRASQQLNRRLSTVADDVVATGVLPSRGDR